MYEIDHHMKPIRGEEELPPTLQDVYELSEAVDVFHKFNETWCEKVFQMEKWTERREQLEFLYK